MIPGYKEAAATGLLAMGPELVLAGTVLVVILVDLFLRRERSHQVITLAAFGVVGALAVTVQQWLLLEPGTAPVVFFGMVTGDSLAMFFRVVILAGTLVALVLSRSSAELWRMRSGEYCTLMLTATIAAMLLVASTNLLMLYLAFETLSLPSYVLAGYRKGSRPAAEASLKYLLFGAAASGVMLYGLSLLYGMAGSLQLDAIAAIAKTNQAPFVLTMGLVLVGFAFKMSAAPFHFWAPDVYEGAPTPFVAYLSVVSKAAAFGAFLRFLAPMFGMTHLAPYGGTPSPMLANSFDLEVVFWVLAVLTMTVGNLVALRQTDVKRLLAYSSIAHAGYMLTAFVAANGQGFQAVLFYFVAYLLMNLGFFAGVVIVVNRTGRQRIADFAGLLYRSPVLAVSLVVLLVSLIGLPPTAGFVAKWKLFAALIDKGRVSPVPAFYYALALIGVLNSVVSAYYYMAIVKVMTFQKGAEREGFRLNAIERVAAAVFAVPVLAIQLYWTPVSLLAEYGSGKPGPAVATSLVKGAK